MDDHFWPSIYPAIAVGRLIPEVHAWYSDAQHAKRCKPKASP